MKKNIFIEKIDRRKLIIAFILSTFFSFILIICGSINKDYSLNNINNFFIKFILYILIIFIIIYSIFNLINKYNKKDKLEISNKKMFLFFFLSFFSIDFIFLLKYFPGILSYDSFNQISQILKEIPLNNTHPIFYTFIISIFIFIGKIFNNLNIGIFLYSLFQLTFMSFIFSTVLLYLKNKYVNKNILILTYLFLLLFPVNIFYSITMWKDIFFSLIFLTFSLLIREIFINEELINKKNIKIYIILLSLLIMFLRNNGVYVIVLFFLFLLLLKTNKRAFMKIFIIIVISFFSSKSIIFNIFNINRGSIREMLSVPSQQFAYIYNDISKKDKDILSKFYNVNLSDVYINTCADPTKNSLNEDYFINNKKEYFILYFKLLKKYPKKYLEAFLSNSFGYYYPGSRYGSVFYEKYSKYGIKSHSLINFKTFIILELFVILSILLFIMKKLDIIKSKRNIIIISLSLFLILFLVINVSDIKRIILINMFFNPGFYFWLLLFSFFYNLYNKKYNILISYIPSFILWLTIIFSPVFSEFRYAYPYVLFSIISFSLLFKIKD